MIDNSASKFYNTNVSIAEESFFKNSNVLYFPINSILEYKQKIIESLLFFYDCFLYNKEVSGKLSE